MLTERAKAATAGRVRAQERIQALEKEAVALASQVATARVAAEQAEAEAGVAMARAGAIAADVLVAEQELAKCREAVEAAAKAASAAAAAAATEPLPATGLEPAPQPETSDAMVLLASAAAEAEARVDALVANKTAAENTAQEVAQGGIAAAEAAAKAAEQEVAVRASLEAAKAEEKAQLEALLAAEAALADAKARVSAPLAASAPALSPATAAAEAAAAAAALAAAAAATAAAQVAADVAAAEAAEGEREAAGEASSARSSRFFPGDAPALPALLPKPLPALPPPRDATPPERPPPPKPPKVPPPRRRGEPLSPRWERVRQRFRAPCNPFVCGAMISGSAGKPYELHPALRTLRNRVGPVGAGVFLAMLLCLVVEMPFVRRVWKGQLPPVASVVASAARAGRKGLEELREKLPFPSASADAGDHGGAHDHGGGDGHGGGHGSGAGMSDVITLLATSVLSVPIISKLPGGSPVLGFLVGGAIVGPSALGLIANVETVKHIAEIGVVFLLFNIGLELSLERLQAMAKYVFGLGTAQMVSTSVCAAAVTMLFTGLSLPASLVVGVGLAFSSTAVALQVLGDRGEGASRHGRAAFSVLLLQDLAVVLVFMLVPLLAPSGADGGIQGAVLLAALGQAVLKTGAAIIVIMAAGRVVLRPVYRRIADLGNTEIFSATTLLVALGTSTLTAALGLSAALGAFLAGLLLAETEYHLQVESDIAPYRGLLLGLFFMTVGMTINPALLIQQFVPIAACIVLLVVGKIALMCVVGPLFGLSVLNAARSGMYIGPGGEFAFVTFGLATACGLLPLELSNTLTLVVALSMAVTPSLGSLGAQLRDYVESRGGGGDMAAAAPAEGEVDDMRGHVIIAGYGRSGQLIAQLLGEQLIPFVALDMRSDRVSAGRDEDQPVFFGDAGSPAVLHSVGAARAACAVVCMDTAGANYRTVYSMAKHYPDVPVFVRAQDVADGLKLEKAGATACVPETLEPSLQLAAAVLAQLDLPPEDVVTAIDSFRRRNISELREMANLSGTSLGYGAQRPGDNPPAMLDAAVAGG